MNFYLAGPMRGIPLYNLNAFALGAYRLRDLGHMVFNPIEIDLALHNLDPHRTLEDQDFDLSTAMKRDLDYIVSNECQGLAMLPGWRRSAGAVVEFMVGKSYGRKLFEFDDQIGWIRIIREENLRLSIVAT